MGRQNTNKGNMKLNQMDPQKSVGGSKEEDSLSGWVIKKMFVGECSIGTEYYRNFVEKLMDLGMRNS